MNSKTILGISLAVIFIIGIISMPLGIADAITGIKKTEIKAYSEEITKLKFQLEDKVPTQPFGGYAIFTDGGAVIAITSHAGFFDSVKQEPPSNSEIALQVGAIASVCNVVDVACGPEWHAHLVEAVTGPLDENDEPICSFAAVGELTFNEPSDSLKIAGKNIVAKGIDIGDEKFVEAIGGSFRDFTVGTPLEGGAAFDLVPALGTPGDISTLQAVCIVPSTGTSDSGDDSNGDDS